MTLEIGANDLLHAVAKCEKEVAEGRWTGPEPLTECELSALPAVIKHIETNIAASLFAIRTAVSRWCELHRQDLFGGFYNPFEPSTPRVWNSTRFPTSWTIVVNIQTKKTVTPFGVCYADPQRTRRRPNVRERVQSACCACRCQNRNACRNGRTWRTLVAKRQQSKTARHPPDATGYEVLSNVMGRECP